MSPKNWNWKKVIRYGVLGFVFYLIFIFLTFPTNLVKDRILNAASKALGMPLHAKQVSLGLIKGVGLKDLEIQLGDKPLVLKKVYLRPSFLGLLSGKQAAAFTVRSSGIDLSGTVSRGKDNLALTANSAQTELSNINQFFSDGDLRLKGKLKGKLKLDGAEKEISQSNFSKANGKINLTVKNGMVDSGENSPPLDGNALMMLQQGGAIPRVEFTRLSIAGTLESGKLQLAEVNLKGKELSGQASGTITLANRLELSKIDLQVEVTVNDKMKPMLEMAKPMLRGVKVDGAKASFALGGSFRKAFIKSK